MSLENIYIFILCIVGILTAGLTAVKIFGNRNGNKKSSNHSPCIMVDRISGIEKTSDERHEGTAKRLERGEEQFDQLFKEQKKQGELMATMGANIETFGKSVEGLQKTTRDLYNYVIQNGITSNKK